MAKELKTLKDLEYKTGSSNQPNIVSHELKAEAIKWVKEDFGDGWSAFRKFHNITSEDLK